MFGTNEKVGAKYFENAGEKLFVTSIFSIVIQGEGPFRGQPAVFIRLAKCNLACSFCDALFDVGDWMTFEEIDKKITESINNFYIDKGLEVPEFAKNRRMLLVLTGGEPMLQANIGKFLETVGATFKDTQIESNGTLLQDIPKNTVLVVSPKCFEKNGKAVKYLQLRKEVLERADCLKFVMSAEQDSPYNSVPIWAHTWAKNTGKDVFVSPMNMYNDYPEKCKAIRAQDIEQDLDSRSTINEIVSAWEPGLLNVKENQANHEYSALYCVLHNFIFQMQLHLYASMA